MLKLRTKLLLSLIAVSGVGIGILSAKADGAYSAICLLMLPFFVALAGASIIFDFSQTGAKASKETARKNVRFRLPHAAQLGLRTK